MNSYKKHTKIKIENKIINILLTMGLTYSLVF